MEKHLSKIMHSKYAKEVISIIKSHSYIFVSTLILALIDYVSTLETENIIYVALINSLLILLKKGHKLLDIKASLSKGIHKIK